ncbi:ATPase [Thermacetogenium phaeum DSM 12270]|uniref:ATPase n=1 Tax=Thermacetogenium phaeum (strain ATCC BAA-254 / DSM 26808 / PB) TaxID=1089553 RepID=K4LHG9_THEPS|nr:MoxR family ATPase [Thermacetogenium phaeum]AFV11395.1 ATPase [Thermacetogenium phaeum DSM 12270]
MFTSVEELQRKLAEHNYLTDRNVATVVYLALKLQKPLLIEGPAGVGKTELAKVLAAATQSRLIRLQCYEGLDEAKALYEWNYQKQLLCLQVKQNQSKSWEEAKEDIFTPEFLLRRPLLLALESREPVVLLIDEVDKSDEEFESFLLEILSDYQITIPEVGTIKATQIPVAVLTSNNFRDFGDALKRRCIHLYLDYPSFERELEIVRLKVPGIQNALAQQLVRFIQVIRKQDLKKPPSIAETIDWARALLTLGVQQIDEEIVQSTLSLILKYQTDIEKLLPKVSSLLPED